MQTLYANNRTIYYALYTGMVDKTVDGLKTGEKVKTYGDPVRFRINVSSAKGNAETEQFGINTDYTKTMVTHDMSCPISEDTILWIDNSVKDANDYIVTKVAKGLNSILYAIKEVR